MVFYKDVTSPYNLIVRNLNIESDILASINYIIEKATIQSILYIENSKRESCVVLFANKLTAVFAICSNGQRNMDSEAGAKNRLVF